MAFFMLCPSLTAAADDPNDRALVGDTVLGGRQGSHCQWDRARFREGSRGRCCRWCLDRWNAATATVILTLISRAAVVHFQSARLSEWDQMCDPAKRGIHGAEAHLGTVSPSFGRLQPRGETHYLTVPLSQLMRFRHNPLFAYVEQRILSVIDQVLGRSRG